MPAGFVKTRLVKKGNRCGFLYDLVTVIRECRFFFRMESHWCMALGRQNLYEDLSARKPANRLVQGNEFPDHVVIGRTV